MAVLKNNVPQLVYMMDSRVSPLPISGTKFGVFNELRMEFRAKVMLAKELGLES